MFAEHDKEVPTSDTSGFIALDGGNLYYEIAGTGEPLIFVHGGSLDARMWDDQWDAFADRYRVVRYDVRGYGRSGPPSVLDRRYDDLKALITHLGLSPAHLVGQSMGGGIVLDGAIAHGDAVRSLTLIAGTMSGWTGWSEDDDDEDLGSVAARDGMDAARTKWLTDPRWVLALKQPAVAARLRTMVAGYSGLHWTTDTGAAPLDPPAARRLAEVRVPTLILVGDSDHPDHRRLVDELMEGIPRARQVVVAGVGHLVNMEAPTEVNGLIRDFLAGITS